MGIFDKLFGTRSQREIKKLQPIVDKIIALEDSYKALSEEELKGKTAVEVGELVHSMMAEDLGPDLVLQENT